MRRLPHAASTTLMLPILLAACSRERDAHVAWLDAMATRAGASLVFVERSRRMVATWEPATGRSAKLSTNDVSPQAAALLPAIATADDVSQSVLVLADGRESAPPKLLLQSLAPGAPDDEELKGAFDRIATAPGSAPFAVAFNDPHFASPRRSHPSALAFACRTQKGALSVHELDEEQELDESDAGAASRSRDFPVLIDWAKATDDAEYCLVADSSLLRIFRLECGSDLRVAEAYRIELRDIDLSATFEVSHLGVQSVADGVHVYAASDGSSLLLHVLLQKGKIPSLQRLQLSGPISALTTFSGSPADTSNLAALTQSTGSQSRLEIARFRADQSRISSVDLDQRFDRFLSESPCPDEQITDDGMLVALGGGEQAAIALIATRLVDSSRGPIDASAAVRTVTLPQPAQYAVRLADTIWALYGERGATVIELGPRAGRSAGIGNSAASRLLPFSEALSSSMPPAVGCATESDQASQVIWSLNPDHDRVVAILASSRQQLTSALPATAVQVLPVRGPSVRAFIIHHSTLGRLTSVELVQRDATKNQVGLVPFDQRYLFATELGGEP